MTLFEASEKYNIPPEILKEYESWGLCSAVKKVMGQWQYDDTDIENLSLIMTLHDLDFKPREIEDFMNLKLSGCACEKLKSILSKKRSNILDEIHFKEKQLQSIDYLTHRLCTKQKRETEL